MFKLFQQVKLSSFGTKNISSLFETFHIEQILTKSKIIKSRGHSIQTMFFCMLILILENSKSVYSGLLTNFSSNMKIPINDILKRINQRKFPYKFVLWDSWYNCSKSFSYVFTKLVLAGKTLISMMKRGNKKYKYGTRYLTIKELYKVTGKWKIYTQSGIKYKSIQVEFLDAYGNQKIKNRNVIGAIKICFFKYPNIKNWKAILSTGRSWLKCGCLSSLKWIYQMCINAIRYYKWRS